MLVLNLEYTLPAASLNQNRSLPLNNFGWFHCIGKIEKVALFMVEIDSIAAINCFACSERNLISFYGG